ncbi:MAG: hypothetical protein JWN72_2127 [Thermoleophilia bacterium]|nr:hypothetical protein [Thermoleophilia bacterium]
MSLESADREAGMPSRRVLVANPAASTRTTFRCAHSSPD